MSMKRAHLLQRQLAQLRLQQLAFLIHVATRCPVSFFNDAPELIDRHKSRKILFFSTSITLFFFVFRVFRVSPPFFAFPRSTTVCPAAPPFVLPSNYTSTIHWIVVLTDCRSATYDANSK